MRSYWSRATARRGNRQLTMPPPAGCAAALRSPVDVVPEWPCALEAFQNPLKRARLASWVGHHSLQNFRLGVSDLLFQRGGEIVHALGELHFGLMEIGRASCRERV